MATKKAAPKKQDERVSHKSLVHLKIAVLKAKADKSDAEKAILKALQEKHKIK